MTTNRDLRLQAKEELKKYEKLAKLTSGGRGAFQVITPTISRDVVRAIRTLEGFRDDVVEAADDVIREETISLTARIAAKWPVETGFSLALWDAVRGGPMEWYVRNLANYSGDVHRKGKEETILKSEINPAAVETREAIVASLRELIDRARRAAKSDKATIPPRLAAKSRSAIADLDGKVRRLFGVGG